MWPDLKLTLSIAMALSASLVNAGNGFDPLPDLTERNFGHQLKRCSAFYAAYSGLNASAMLDTIDPLEKARLQDIKKQSEENSDGMLKAAVLVITKLDGVSDAEAVNISVDARAGYTIKYLQRFFSSNATLSNPFLDDVWKNDAASCAAILQNIGPVVESLLEE